MAAATVAFAVATLLCLPVCAEDSWLIVPSTVGIDAPERDGVRDGVRAVVADLSRRLAPPGATIVDPVRARDMYEQRGSTPPMMFSHSDLDALARDTQMALYHVASGLPARARRDVERALARADKVLESLNRESLAAQQLLDACLFLVRAHLQAGRRGAAREQALECRRLVPDIEPDGTTHPPDVIGLLAEAEAHLRINQPGALRVDSEPSGCAVYVNGRRLGTAPLELSQLGPGEYRVQAECSDGKPGRVHRVQIGSTRVTLRIDVALDSAVSTATGLSLHYDSAQREAEHGERHAAELARAVGASHVLWVSAAAGNSGGVQLRLLRVADQQLLASAGAHLADGRVADIEETRRALVAPTRAAAIPAATAARPTATDTKHAVEPSQDGVAESGRAPDATVGASSEPSGRSPWLVGGAIAGGAALATGWVLWVVQHADEVQHADAVDAGDDYRDTLGDARGGELTHLWVAGAGAVVGAATLSLLDTPASRSGWWASAAAVTGVGLLAGGIALAVAGAHCDDFDDTPLGRCTDTIANSRLGPMLAITAVPILSIPVAYLLRDDSTSGMAVGVRPHGRRGAVLSLGGTL